MHLRLCILLAAVAGSSSAQFVYNNTIGSCADVHCPVNNYNSQAACQIANRSHITIGLGEIPSRITDNDANLTWTVGTQVFDNREGDSYVRRIEKDFYLGKPPSLELAQDGLPYSGCAIFLYGNGVPGHWRTIRAHARMSLNLGASKTSKPMPDLSSKDSLRT